MVIMQPACGDSSKFCATIQASSRNIALFEWEESEILEPTKF